MMTDTMHTTSNVARILSCTEDYVRILVKQGRLKAMRLGEGPRAQMRFKPEEVERFIEDGQAARLERGSDEED